MFCKSSAEDGKKKGKTEILSEMGNVWRRMK